MSSKDRLAAVVVTITLAVSAFAIGSAPRWAACITVGLCLLTVVPLARSRRYLERRPLVLTFLLIAACATAVQLLPLPSGLVGLISPHRWDLAIANAKAWDTDPSSLVPLTYDSPGTLVELAKFCGYFAFAYACFWLAVSSAGRRWLMTAVAIVGGAMALTALAHGLVGADKLYGVYTPSFPAPRFMGPLLNPNHMAGLLAFSTPVTIGLAVASQGGRRLAFIGVGFLCAGVAFLTQSRGGAISVVVASAATGVLLWQQKRRADQAQEVDETVGVPKHVLVPAIVIMSCALALLVAVTAGGVAQELSSTTAEQLSGETYKLEAWKSSKNMMGRHALTGVGRGAFEFAFTRDHPASGTKTYSHIENEYLQTILDWGVPVAAALGILAGLIGLSALRRRMVGPLEAGAVGGLMALALHNFVDFNLEFPAVALPTLAALAVLLPGKLKETRSPRRRQMVRLGGVVGAAVVVVLAASPLGRRAQAEADDLDEDLDAAGAVVPHELIERAETMTRRHPSDYVAFGQAARVLVARNDRRAVDIVNRALDLNPQHSGLHWLAAQMLASSTQAREQALLEYSLSLKTLENPRPILADLLVRFADVKQAARGLPSVADVLEDERLAGRLTLELSVLKRNDVALAWAERLHQEIPDNPDMAGLVADFAVLTGHNDEALVAGDKAYAMSQTAQNAMRLARALMGLGRSAQAESILNDAIVRARSRGTRVELVDLLTLLGDVQREENKLLDARTTLNAALNLVGSNRKATALIYRVLAKVEDALGNPTVASVYRTRAEQFDPTDLGQIGTGGVTAPPPTTPPSGATSPGNVPAPGGTKPAPTTPSSTAPVPGTATPSTTPTPSTGKPASGPTPTTGAPSPPATTAPPGGATSPSPGPRPTP